MISVQEYNAAVQEYTKNIFRFLYKALRDEDAVNDLVQDCYLKLWQHRESVNPQKVKAWLFSVAYHALCTHLKTNARSVPLQDSTPLQPVYQQHGWDTRELLEKILNDLPPLQKSILLLRDLEGYEYREIGEILALGESQVKVYLFRARQRVKETINKLEKA
ncbi:RNA polymerase sigma factor [Cesiribacter andamanensis]|uniref:RNA polymerase sigma factor sigM n=1 Tax=Cesiribacter andamanensis AMV16 TaxID=1279009 RepID=M7N748_9BACT|nr:RNA polymerase sigma factor [Cesiribacter andamanensis]EMR03097.1 RNA polymerase sigma factor sigM [Cesiribacter andamanensis AMV16]